MRNASFFSQALLFILLGIACFRTLLWQLDGQDRKFAESHPELWSRRLQVDFFRDGWEQLAMVPGLSSAQAKSIVRGRMSFDSELTAHRLRWIPGIGVVGASSILVWLQSSKDDPP